VTPSPTYDVLDPALDSIAEAGPDLRNGLTNHAPMAIEALCALGREGAVEPWLAHYREGFLPWPARCERIEREGWQAALGRPERTSDWRAFLRDELEAAPWREVLERWTARLAPGICANATHGVIRVGHAARALGLAETPARRRELADALASWASSYQTLPTDLSAAPPALPPGQAILQVPRMPPEQRRFTGTITGSLEALDAFPPFAGVIALAKLDGDPAARSSELTETFARVLVANTRDTLSAIVFVHGVTSIAAVRSLLPYLGADTARAALRYAWQASCALYAAFGQRPAPALAAEPPRETASDLVEMAIASRDEHAIKLTEACLREHALRPAPEYLAAARQALDFLRA
jgi:Questin oxidase-like